MRLLRPLAHRPIAILWAGQVTSYVGDELYAVAVVWLMLDAVGTDAGYLGALRAGAILAASLVAGVFTHRWSARRAMVGADVLRGLLVLVLPAWWAVAGRVPAPAIALVTMAIGAFGAVFDPALQSVVPTLTARAAAAGQRALDPNQLSRGLELELRAAVNGLFDSTFRLARIGGPGLVAFVAGVLPMIHFFTLDAMTFAASALAVGVALRRDDAAFAVGSTSWRDLVFAGFRRVRREPLLAAAFAGSALANVVFALGFTFGVPVLLRASLPADEALSTYGAFVAAYGVGNVASNVLLTSRAPSARVGWQFPPSLLMLGSGFVAIALFAPSRAILVVAAVMATTGPLYELTSLRILQERFEPDEIPSVHRVKLMATFGGVLVGSLLATVLLGLAAPATVLLATGLAAIGAGLALTPIFRRLAR